MTGHRALARHNLSPAVYSLTIGILMWPGALLLRTLSYVHLPPAYGPSICSLGRDCLSEATMSAVTRVPLTSA
jgi:hypothetical protein